MNISSSIRRIYAVGVACAILAVFIGFVLERARFGSSDEDALSRAERSSLHLVKASGSSGAAKRLIVSSSVSVRNGASN